MNEYLEFIITSDIIDDCLAESLEKITVCSQDTINILFSPDCLPLQG